MTEGVASEKSDMGSIKECTILIYYYIMIPYFWFRDPAIKDPSIYAHIQIFNY